VVVFPSHEVRAVELVEAARLDDALEFDLVHDFVLFDKLDDLVTPSDYIDGVDVVLGNGPDGRAQLQFPGDTVVQGRDAHH